MKILINIAHPSPVYEQIVSQIEQAVLNKDLKPGSPLPSVRQLANDLELNPNTVAKAYQILERNRVIFTAGRKGSFVHKEAEANTNENLENGFKLKFSELVQLAFDQGLSNNEIKNIFNLALNSAKGVKK